MSKDIKVVVLDDEQNILESLERLFFKEDFGVFTTTDHKEAMKMLEKEKIKLVMSDQRMPDITGVEFLKQVKEKYPDVMRILITGHTDIQSAEDAINFGGVYRFINKPWNSDELKGAVRQAIKHYDLVIENRNLFDSTKIKNEELEILNRKLKSMYEVQKDFSSTVSHELRTPLASIKSTVDLVLSGAPGPLSEDQAKFLNKTRSNVDRLNRLINDILDLTKMESGKTQLNIIFSDMGIVLNEVVETQSYVAKEKGLYLKCEIAQELPKVPVDVDKMHQVLNNLISNAIKFTESGGITISCNNLEESNSIEIRIKDTGPGIKVEDIDKLFQKFQQIGESIKHVGGTGLGLAICKEIVNRHGGKIWVESEEGKGSSFCFLLPIQERRKESI
ncbi:MAG: response regulator [Candidatus Omnitrophica bacterium]|nr:response regulator [Candidatus Omnitrophota bacterium]MBU1996006.1 response regulator [Candidatus Omnitrophota bacterium]